MRALLHERHEKVREIRGLSLPVLGGIQPAEMAQQTPYRL
jgi:hypothetical protein